MLEVLKQLAIQLFNQTIIILLASLVVFLVFYHIIWRRRAEKRYSPITENMLRSPARSLEPEFQKFDEKLIGGMVGIIAPVVVGLVADFKTGLSWLFVIPFSVGSLIYTVRVLQKALQMRLAIDGEEYTGMELNYLMRSGAWVYHDIPFQYGNIDHIVVSTGGVFTVETKTIRKPEGKSESTRQANVSFDGNSLSFPHFGTSTPLHQARLQAEHVREAIAKNLGITVAVTPVVALPGWFIERKSASDVWIINPKRGEALAAQVKKATMSPEQALRIANYIESVVRSTPPTSKKMDPDASKHYDFWNNRRFEERKLG